MHRYLKARLLASVLVLTAVPATVATTPSAAAVSVSIGFNYFHDNLSDYGDWVYSGRWGRVWRPDVDADFRPYSRGHWVYTDDYGWFWDSDEPFGDITYHYGRWVNDPDDGWLWIPGYVWSPAWVVWRSNGDYTGWMPMPPTEAFLAGDETSYDIGDDYDYGYSRWYPGYSSQAYASLWVFVGNRYISDRNYRNYVVRRPRVGGIIRQTRNVTSYRVVNNYVVNRGINVNIVQRAGGRVQRVKASAVIKRPDLVTHADRGREIQSRMRRDAPHGTGMANSAPKPTAQQIQTLSPTIRARGNKPKNLLTRAKAEEQQRSAPANPAGAVPQTPGKPETANPPSTREERRERGGRQQGEPANTAKPAETAPVENRMNENRPGENRAGENKPNENGNGREERRNNARERPQNNTAAPNTPPPTNPPAAELPQNPMREQRLQQRENVPATLPAAKPAEAPAPAQPARSLRDEMRQRMQDRANERARENVPPAAPPAAERQQMPEQAAPQREPQPMRERATPPAQPPAAAPAAAAPQQRERPAGNERRGNRGDDGEKKKDDDKNKNPD